MPKKKILVVDDESGFTRLLKLTMSKYEIREVNDPTRAIASAKEFGPDLILLDVIMPGMDGGDLAAQIRSDAALRRTPIVFLTAVVTDEETGGESQKIGGFPFVAKPVDPEALTRCIEQNLVR